ncbi:MAG: NUDIX domain-containing protein, partial [Anaerolineae bacterium]|nr:NUDIX domain-containing protein [Anaerolineae bacterium]
MSVRLVDLVEPGGEVTSGLVLRYRGFYLFGVEPKFQWTRRDDRWDLRYIGIGGHQDPGETWGETVAREAWEEAGCQIEVKSADVTYECLPDGQFRPLDLLWDEPVRPWFIWRDHFDLSARRGPGATAVPFLGLVFCAQAIPPLKPGAEIPALIGLSATQVVDTLE